MIITVWAFEQKKKKYTTQDVMIPWHLQKRFELKDDANKDDNSEAKVLHRYYHLFKEKELESLIAQVDCLEVVESFWDVDNWYVLVQKKS